MSKIDDLKQKYSGVSAASFKKFVNADTTPTKKYLEFMLRTWEERKTSPQYRTVGTIISYTNKFDTLLPFIENKDIYSKTYLGNLSHLIEVVKVAEEIKDEKTFVKEEHVSVLMETADTLFVFPRTHRGSMKYGAHTKWCTTARGDGSVFDRYSRKGLLIYLIDKSKTKTENFQKVAFYMEYNMRGLNEGITLYDVSDSIVHEKHLITAGGWDQELLFELFTRFRYCFLKNQTIKQTKDFVDTFVNTISQLDFIKFKEELSKLDESTNVSYITEAQNKVESFIQSLNNTKYGIGKTEN